jgi:uncharacterized membrane protein YjjB (DUF3815 family)
MEKNSPVLDSLKAISQMQQSEASIHWSRNNIFLVCSSILLLALSQFKQLQLCILISALGIVLNFAWLLFNIEVASISFIGKMNIGDFRQILVKCLIFSPRG